MPTNEDNGHEYEMHQHLRIANCCNKWSAVIPITFYMLQFLQPPMGLDAVSMYPYKNCVILTLPMNKQRPLLDL